MSEGEEGGVFGFGGGGEEDGGGGFGVQDKKKKKDGGDKIIKHSTVLRVVFEEDTAPLFVTVQSFSWGVNGPYNSSSVGKAGGPFHPTDPKDPIPSKWSVDDVVAWLEKHDLAQPQFVKWVREEEVNGTGLIALTDTILKDNGIKPFGYRARLIKAIEPLIIRESQLGPNYNETTWQDMQISAQFNVAVNAMMVHVSTKKTLAEASLTLYHGSQARYGNRNNLSDEFDMGEALLQYDLVKPYINGFQVSGSQGALEQMYISMQVSCEAMLIHSCVTNETRNFGVNSTRTMLGLAPVSAEKEEEQKEKRLYAGTTTYISQQYKASQPSWQQRWGREISWSKEMHRFFPRPFRLAVRTLWLIRNRKDSVFAKMPRDAMMVLIKIMSLDANPSPFHPYPFPLVDRNDANNNDW